MSEAQLGQLSLPQLDDLTKSAEQELMAALDKVAINPEVMKHIASVNSTPILDFIIDEMRRTESYSHIYNIISNVGGWLLPGEALMLLLLGASAPTEADVLEIGAYKGRSTAFIAFGSRLMGRGKINVIDNFNRWPSDEEDQSVLDAKTTYYRYESNLKALRLWDFVSTMRVSSRDAAQNWNRKLRLLFLGSHSTYREQRDDFEMFSKFVNPTGIVCFHDLSNSMTPDTDNLFRELTVAGSGWKPYAALDTLVAVERV